MSWVLLVLGLRDSTRVVHGRSDLDFVFPGGLERVVPDLVPQFRRESGKEMDVRSNASADGVVGSSGLLEWLLTSEMVNLLRPFNS